MVTTGLCLIYAGDIAWLHPWEHDIKEVHGAVMYAILGFVVIHVAGVVWGEMHNDRNITSDMINGGQPVGLDVVAGGESVPNAT